MITSEPIIWLDSIKPNKIKIFDKKPLSGGIPATEKKIIINENDHNLFDLKKLDKLDKYKGVEFTPLNKLVLSWKP